jgi:hypothetical protein
MWFAYFHHDLLPALGCEARMPVFEGFRRFCAASPKRPDVQEAIDHAQDQGATPFDTHPSLDERLAALGARGTADCTAQGAAQCSAQCSDLLGGEDRIEAMWYQRINGSEWPAVGWDEFGDAVLRPRIAQRFTGTRMAPEQMPLTELPAAAQSLDAWWARLQPDGPSLLSPEGKRRYVLGVLREWVIASLCHAGFTLRARPGTSLVLDRGGVTVDPSGLLASACEGRLAAGDLAEYAQTGSGQS